MSTRNFWELSSKSKLSPASSSVALRHLNPSQKRGCKVFFIYKIWFRYINSPKYFNPSVPFSACHGFMNIWLSNGKNSFFWGGDGRGGGDFLYTHTHTHTHTHTFNLAVSVNMFSGL